MLKVTADRSWRKISVPLNLPSTCTNSAFVMKNVYIKFLLAYEKVNFWGEKDVSIVQQPPKKGEKTSSSSSKNSSPYISNKVLKTNKLPIPNLPQLQPYQLQQIQKMNPLQPIQKQMINNQVMDPNLLRKPIPQMPMPIPFNQQQQQQQPYMQQMYNNQGKMLKKIVIDKIDKFYFIEIYFFIFLFI